VTQGPRGEALPITLAEGTADAGLAGMIAGLIRANLVAHPERRRDFERLRGTVVIEAHDAEAVVTLAFDGGTLLVRGGHGGAADVHVWADSLTVIELSSLPIVGGIPWLFGHRGRRLVGGLLRGTVRIRGLYRAATLVRLTRLLSVA
jgi:hypothetical protein